MCGIRADPNPQRYVPNAKQRAGIGGKMPLQVKCPDCGEAGKIAKNGKKWSGRHKLQMFRCNACGKVFSERALVDSIAEVKKPEVNPLVKPEAPKPEPKQEEANNLLVKVCPACEGKLWVVTHNFKNSKGEIVTRYKCSKCKKKTVSPKEIVWPEE